MRRPGGTDPPGWVAGGSGGGAGRLGCPSPSASVLPVLLGSARVGGGGLDLAHFAEGHSDLDTCTPRTLPARSAGSAEPRTCCALTWSPAHVVLSLPHAPMPQGLALPTRGPAAHPLPPRLRLELVSWEGLAHSCVSQGFSPVSVYELNPSPDGWSFRLYRHLGLWD